MKKTSNLIAFIGFVFVLTMAMQVNTFAQQLLLSEIEIDPPSTASDSCQYAEIVGTPGSVVPANTYFLSVNSDGANFGFANQAVNLGGVTVGSNGTIYLFNTTFGACPNRTAPAGSTVVNYTSGFPIGGAATSNSSETYLLVRSTVALQTASDFDSDDDGVFNTNLGLTILDGFAFIINPKEEYVYGAEAGVVNISNTTAIDQPDAVTRFAGNTTPFAPSAFYYGELATSPDETTQYAAPLSANFPSGGQLTPGAPNVPVVTAVKSRADFDGDGRTDISVFRPGTQGFWFLNRSTAGQLAIPFGQTNDRLVPGDYDNDGKADIAVRRGQIWYILNSQNSTVTSFQFGLENDVPVPGDYDGDGDTDAAVFRPSTGTWYTSTNAAINYGAFAYGQNGDVPVPADYDGDGKTDIAVFRSGTWFINRSTAGSLAVAFGTSTDSPVPADYDGDNRDDVTVFRASEGVWYALQSSNNTVAAIRFGQNGDVPVPGDYDGDGKDDQAVFRAGNWFLNRSTGGATTVVYGAGSDQPVPKAYIP